MLLAQVKDGYEQWRADVNDVALKNFFRKKKEKCRFIEVEALCSLKLQNALFLVRLKLSVDHPFEVSQSSQQAET